MSLRETKMGKEREMIMNERDIQERKRKRRGKIRFHGWWLSGYRRRRIHPHTSYTHARTHTNTAHPSTLGTETGQRRQSSPFFVLVFFLVPISQHPRNRRRKRTSTRDIVLDLLVLKSVGTRRGGREREKERHESASSHQLPPPTFPLRRQDETT